jgi:hypothetical protein
MRQFERSLIAVACIRGWLHSLLEHRFYAAGSAKAAPLSLLQEGLGKRSNWWWFAASPALLVLFHTKEKSYGAFLSSSLSTLASGDISRIYVELQMAPKRLSLFLQFLWRYSNAAWVGRCKKRNWELF